MPESTDPPRHEIDSLNDFDVAVEVAHPQQVAAATQGGIRLPPGLAAAARDFALGAIDLARIEAHDPLLVRMKPTPELAARLADGSASLMERGGESFFGIARDADSKKIIQHVELEHASSARSVEHARAAAGATFAWQALAVATQQHYLVEISSGLEAIEAAVDELGFDNERDDDAELATAMRELSRVERHLETGAPTTPADRALAESTYAAAERIADARLRKVDALLPSNDDSRAPSDAPKIMRQLGLAKRALAVSARSASLVTQLPDQDAQRALNDLEHYAERFDDLRLRVDDATVALQALAAGTEEAWAQHRRARTNLGANVRRLKDPLESVAAAPVIGPGYVAARKTVRRLARRGDTPTPRASFDSVDLHRLRAPKKQVGLAVRERAIVEQWAASVADPGPNVVECLVQRDEVRLLGRGCAVVAPTADGAPA